MCETPNWAVRHLCTVSRQVHGRSTTDIRPALGRIPVAKHCRDPYPQMANMAQSPVPMMSKMLLKCNRHRTPSGQMSTADTRVPSINPENCPIPTLWCDISRHTTDWAKSSPYRTWQWRRTILQPPDLVKRLTFAGSHTYNPIVSAAWSHSRTSMSIWPGSL